MPDNLTVPTLEDVIAKVQGRATPSTGFILQEPIRVDKRVGFEGVTFDIPKNAIYDRLNDGTYSPRYENYQGAVGNEDRLARQQSGWDQAWHGLSKAAIKTVAYAADAIIGTAYGVYNGIDQGSWEAVWNNEVSQSIDDFNKRLDNNLVNYYTDEEKSNGMLAMIPGFGATNFWFNDVAGGMAFVAGAILPEVAIGALSGGATIGTSAARMSLKYGGKALMKQGIKQGIKEGAEQATKKTLLGGLKQVSGYNAYKKGTEVLRGYQRAVFTKVGGDILGTGMFLARTSNFEAGMEARHNFHTSIESFYLEFEELNGRRPSYEETSDFIKDATSAANGVYAANLAILTVSNAVMFSNKFNVGVQANKSMSNSINRSFGLGVKHTAGAKSVMHASTKGQRALGNAYLILGKPAVEGLYEEGFQGVAGTTMQNYLKAKYNPDVESGYDFWASLSDAFAHQYGTKEGWKEMGIGMIIGSMGGTMQKGAPNFAGFGKKGSRKSRQAAIEKQVEAANQAQDNLIKRVNKSTAMDNYSNVAKSGGGTTHSPSVDNSIINSDYISSQEVLKSTDEILADYDAIIDNTELTEAQREAAEEMAKDGAVNPELDYKAGMKEQFRKDMKNHKFAKKAVAALGLTDTGKDTKGNTWEIEDAMVRNIMVGRSALEHAKTVASHIEAVTGVDGVFSALEHYSGLEEGKRKAVESLREKTNQLEVLRAEYRNFANKIAGLPSKGAGRYSEETKHRRYKEAAEKAALVQGRINKLEQEITDISEALSFDMEVESFSMDSLKDTDGSTNDMLKAVSDIERLEKFITSLEKAKRGEEATQLKGLVEEYKLHSDAHREMNNTYRRMLDTNFFKSKEGKGLRKAIIGDKYTMSEEFKKVIKENDELIDKSLKTAGYRSKEKVEKIIKDNLEENEELSEREKFRLESIIRLQLTYGRVAKQIKEAEKEASEEVPKSGKTSAKGPLKGDTVSLKREVVTKGKDLGNATVLDKLIAQITKELDGFRLSKVNNARIKGLDSQLNELKEKRDKIDKEAIEARIKELEAELKAVKEVGEDTAIKNVEEQLADQKELLPKELDAQIKATETELKEAKEEKFYTIMKSPQYRRLYELNKKKANKEITPEEIEELEELEEGMDQWMMATGIVTNGLRLSDLIQQRASLETEVRPIQEVVTPNQEDVMSDSHIPDKGNSVNYSLMQTYDGVTVIKNKKGETEIAGITWEKFAQIAGIPLKAIKTKTKNKKKIPVAPFTTNDRGNILLTDELVETINEIGNISILATNEGLTTNYSMVLRTLRGKDGPKATVVLKTDYEFSNDMNPNAIYDMKPGDEVDLEVSSTDPFNKELIDRYNGEKNAKKKEAIKEEMRDKLVIRVLRRSGGGEFVAVLKGKREGGVKDRNVAPKFEALRSQIIDDAEFFEKLIETESNYLLKKFDGLVVEDVYVGHPTFNYKQNPDKTISEVTKPLTAIDIEKIEDTGYLDKEGTHTMSGKNSVDTRFLRKAHRDAPNAKIPFVVISKGSQRIAFPVKIEANPKEDLTRFRDIYNSKMDPSDKASELNIFMAGKGINIKGYGNSFVGFGETNLNDKFFSEKLAELEAIDYFRDLNSWVNPRNSKEQVLSQGVSTNINLADPLHSPKVKLNFEGLDIEVSSENIPSPSKANKKTSTEELKGLDDALKITKEKDC